MAEHAGNITVFSNKKYLIFQKLWICTQRINKSTVILLEINIKLRSTNKLLACAPVPKEISHAQVLTLCFFEHCLCNEFLET